MTAAGASKHALARAVRACRRELAAIATGRPTATLARDLFRAVVERHVAAQPFSLDEAEIPWLFACAPDVPAVPAVPTNVRAVLDRVLAAPDLDTVWTDASVLGWVYQFWSDESREAIDARIGARGRVTPAEIAEKTQLFTERYMVDWLLENSLGAAVRALGTRRRARLGLPAQSGTTSASPYFVAEAGIDERDEIPDRLRELKVLDPACGSGHFLVGAFDLLVPHYRAEAADEGRALTNAAIAHEILAHNLHGLDIDSEAVRITATVLLLKAKRFAAPEPFQAPALALLGLGFDEAAHQPGSEPFERSAREVFGGSASVAAAVQVLADWSFRGTLTRPPGEGLANEVRTAMRALLDGRGPADDLGVRCVAPLLPCDERLEMLLADGRYDVVVANPPYLATAKIAVDKARLAEVFGEQPDLFAAFVDRSLALCKPRGRSAFVAPSNWLFLSTFAAVRARVLEGELVLVADLGKGAFRHASKLIQTSMVVTIPQRAPGRAPRPSLGARIGNPTTADEQQTERLAAALSSAAVFTPFDPDACQAIAGAPLLFWLDRSFLERYRAAAKIEDVASGAVGMATGDNERFLRAVWEIAPSVARAAAAGESDAYVPYLKGADGEAFFEPYRWVLRVPESGLSARLNGATFELPVPRSLGVAYTTIGHRFAARLHTVPSVRDVSGASFFPREGTSVEELLCALNRTPVRELAHALNPSINFQQVDVRRLPFERHPRAESIVRELRASFDRELRTRETSLSFTGPGPSSWQATQRWAQRCIDDPACTEPSPAALDATAADAASHVSAALGLALGRFARTESGLRLADPSEALGLPYLFLDAAGDDDLESDAAAPLRAAWASAAERGAALSPRPDSLGNYLRTHTFDHHLASHDGRPAYLPLASRRRSLVIFVWAQRLDASTLRVLLDDRLGPKLRSAQRAARTKSDRAAKARLQEITAFVTEVRALLRRGPASPDVAKEKDLPFVPFADDGVRILAASLWPLVWPLWKEPRADWLALAAPSGKRGFDWSRTAARYFPSRVEAACRRDASLACEHGLLRALHGDVARKWESKLSKSLAEAKGQR